MALISVEGQITAIQHPSRTLVIKDIQGISHPVRWPEGLDGRMQKQQQWWFAKVTGEESDGVIMLQDLGYYKRPDNWPSNTQGHGKGNFTPSPKSSPVEIARQSSLKVASEVVLSRQGQETRPADVVSEDIITLARLFTKFVQEG